MLTALALWWGIGNAVGGLLGEQQITDFEPRLTCLNSLAFDRYLFLFRIRDPQNMPKLTEHGMALPVYPHRRHNLLARDHSCVLHEDGGVPKMACLTGQIR